MGISLYSKIVCPGCKEPSRYEMPERGCQLYVKCPLCKRKIKAERGHGCVYCSHGDTPCPPRQRGEGC